MNSSLWRTFGKGPQGGLKLIRLFGMYETNVGPGIALPGFSKSPFSKGGSRGILV